MKESLKKLTILELINVRWYNACAWYAVTLSCALKRKGHRVIVGGDPGSPPATEAKKLGLETYSKLWFSKMAPFTFIYNLKRLAEFLEKERIDVINAHRSETHLLSSLLSYLGKKKIGVIRPRGDVRNPKSNFLNRYLNNSLTDKIIITSEVLKESYLYDLKIPGEKVKTVAPGIDQEFFFPQPKSKKWKEMLKLDDDFVVVGIVGRLSPVKGHEYFIKAASHVLKNSTKKIKFLIAGEDAQIKLDFLEKIIHRTGMSDNFILVGKVEDVRGLISLFDIGVISSVGSEMVCRVALEYMAMGKPVVGTRVNAIPEMVEDRTNGILVSPEDETGLGRAILELTENETERKVYGRVGRKMVEKKYNLDNFASRTEEVYYQVLKDRGMENG
jgi:glycosyltransferase involved in cell wall biosynthesis